MRCVQVKIENVSGDDYVILDKVIEDGGYEYYLKDDVLNKTDAYELAEQGLLIITEADVDTDNFDTFDEIDGRLYLDHDANGNLVYAVVFYDVPNTNKRYEMIITHNQGVPYTSDEVFYYTDGDVMLRKRYRYLYDFNTKVFLGRQPL